MAEAKRDGNRVTTLIGVSSVDLSTPTLISVNPATGAMLAEGTITPLPAGSDTQVQFNDGGVFGGDAGFTYNKTTNVLTIEDISGVEDVPLTITSPSSNGELTSINITAGAGTSGDNGGNQVNLQGGDASGNQAGGGIFAAGGVGGVTGVGGSIEFEGGAGGVTSGDGGSISLIAGSAQAGDSNGGNIIFEAGGATGTGLGGGISLIGGANGNTLTGGSVDISSAEETQAGVTTIEGGGSTDIGAFSGGEVVINGGVDDNSTNQRPLILQRRGGQVKIGKTLSLHAILDTSSIDTSDKTFTFPNRTGYLALATQGADVASANNLALGSDGNVFEITGAVQINLISNVGFTNGTYVTLLFTSNPVVKHNQATSGTDITIQLAGAVDFSASAGDTLTLVLSEIGGTQAWREISRAVI